MESLILYLSYATFNTIGNCNDERENFKFLTENIENLENKIKSCCSRQVEVNELLIPYMEYLKKELRTFDLFNLYKNMEDLKLKKDKKIILLGQLGSYNPRTNIIKYIKEECLGHELLHVASANVVDENEVQVGFSVNKGKKRIGNAINEGYTDHLNDKYFNNHAKAYNCIRKIASYTEELVGEENMKKAYFNNDLLSLIRYLEKYMTREEVIKFIILQDSLLSAKSSANIYYKKPEHEINKILEKSFKQKALIK